LFPLIAKCIKNGLKTFFSYFSQILRCIEN
jgi:hypothetical protein